MRDTRSSQSAALRAPAAALLIILTVLPAVLTGCGKQKPPQQVSKLVGHRFPTVSGKDLTKHVVSIPGDWAGAPVIVLVTPSKGSQPDADRWIAALRTRTGVEFRETPVIDSVVARVMQGFIAGKMRGGLPRDMWPRVIPLFKDGGKVKSFFGDYGDRLAYVVVLDKDGVIRWFSAEGYSDSAGDQVVAAYHSLSH